MAFASPPLAVSCPALAPCLQKAEGISSEAEKLCVALLFWCAALLHKVWLGWSSSELSNLCLHSWWFVSGVCIPEQLNVLRSTESCFTSKDSLLFAFVHALLSALLNRASC